MPPAFVGAVQQPRAPAVATLVDLAIVALASLVLSFSHHQAACSLRFETNVAKGENQVLRNRIELLAAERQKSTNFASFSPGSSTTSSYMIDTFTYFRRRRFFRQLANGT